MPTYSIDIEIVTERGLLPDNVRVTVPEDNMDMISRGIERIIDERFPNRDYRANIISRTEIQEQ